MSSSADLGQQADFAAQLNSSLSQINNKMNAFADASRTQATFANQIAESFSNASQSLNASANSFAPLMASSNVS